MNQPNFTSTSEGFEPQADARALRGDSEVSVPAESIARLIDSGAVAKKLKLPTHLAGGNWRIELGAMVVVCLLALGCSFVAKTQVDRLAQENERWKIQLAETETQLSMSRSDLDMKSRQLAVAHRELAALKMVDKNRPQTAGAGVETENRASTPSERVYSIRENYSVAPGRYVQVPRNLWQSQRVSSSYPTPYSTIGPIPGPPTSAVDVTERPRE